MRGTSSYTAEPEFYPATGDIQATPQQLVGHGGGRDHSSVPPATREIARRWTRQESEPRNIFARSLYFCLL